MSCLLSSSRVKWMRLVAVLVSVATKKRKEKKRKEKTIRTNTTATGDCWGARRTFPKVYLPYSSIFYCQFWNCYFVGRIIIFTNVATRPPQSLLINQFKGDILPLVGCVFYRYSSTWSKEKMHMVVMSFVDAILFVFVFFLILFSKNILGEGFPDT